MKTLHRVKNGVGSTVSIGTELPVNRTALPESGSDIRWDLVARIKAEIAARTYETEEKWEAALDQLSRRLSAE
ncbi:hypothetical protein [Tuwongella immobilis]|uniref:Anti-sigma-28 factor FlgM C-terminal domain-containing protein n=1 Tax=Tuwongella immobilis TaxID=692036 RepID=A0A6C2YN72_9BACT|nr:hypothetical protein [Tuwongella immobilis]VIP02515.1 unnamed protein product [Tuwongella immobilis]VTS01634.1 unnamed protein product [Tuwongella immobilis]